MKIITRTTLITVVFVFLTVVTFSLISSNDTSTAQEVNTITRTEVRLATSSLSLPVVGVIEAVETATMYAKTAGVVTAIPHKEGSVVTSGAVLALQDTPVEHAQRGLAEAQGALVASQQTAQMSVTEANSKKADVHAYTATEIATLRAGSNDRRLSETISQVTSTVNASVATTLAVMDYINNNRSLLTAESRETYQEAVRLAYGNQVTYFDATFLTGVNGVEGETLVSLGEKAHTSPVAAQTVLSLTAKVLALLNEVLTHAEDTVFDRNNGQDDAGTTAYLAQKTAVTTALSGVEMARSSAQQVIDATLEDAVAQKTTVIVSDVDRDEAMRQNALATEIASRARDVSTATVAVAVAQSSLGVTVAPFHGVVTTLFANEGEYVMPGTPLLQIVGTGAKELSVTVPDVFISSVAIGQPFMVRGETVGFVDRFSPVSEGHGHTVIVALTEGVAPVGAPYRGHIVMDTVVGVYAVPRAYVHFTSGGASVVYQGGEEVLAEVVYDAGDTLFVAIDTVKDEALMPAVLIPHSQ